MGYPTEYTEAYDALVAFRNDILLDLVGARVKALLDAGHDCMEKYRALVDKLGISTYLFKDIQRKALVWRLKGMDLGEGKMRYAKTLFDEPLALYPLTPPYNVPQRLLPQVDVFSFTARSSVDIKEMSGGAQLQGIVTLQCGNNDFLETPDAENALYDYYFLYPLIQRDALYTPSGAMHGVEDWRGIGTQMVRTLHRTSDGVSFTVFAELFFDAMVNWTVGDDTPVLVTARFSPEFATPVTTLVLSQYRIHSDKKGIWMTLVGIIPSLGWFQVGTGLTSVTEEKVVWKNHFLVTLSVNDILMGYLSPAVGDYTHEADYNLIVTAYPESGYEVDKWELDGVWVDDDNQYGFFVRKSCELKCFFKLI